MTAVSLSSAGAARNLGLDIVRATAILLVLVGHYGPPLLLLLGVPDPARFPGPAAYLGVELFFVLSGFLIGRILFGIAHTQPTPGALLVFLTRRWMRTLPLYLAWIALLWAFLPYDRQPLGELLRYVTLTQNFYRPMPVDNWFAVSWSLTVEEWFYLLFGSCVILSAAWLPRRLAIWLPIALFIAAPTFIRCTLSPADLLFEGREKVALLRLDAIAYGAALAAISMARPDWLKRSWTLLGIGLILVVLAWENWVLLLVPWHMRGSLMLSLTSLGLVLCLPAAMRIDRVPAWFAAAARTISAQSYGLYIMHLTFLDLSFWVRGPWPWISWPIAMVASLALPFALSWLSFRYFETPILNLRPSQNRGHGARDRRLLVRDAASPSS